MALSEKLVSLADSGKCDAVLTTGGTGLGPRDVTPEATANILREARAGAGRADARARETGYAEGGAVASGCGRAGARDHCEFAGEPEGGGRVAGCGVRSCAHAVEVLRGARHD